MRKILTLIAMVAMVAGISSCTKKENNIKVISFNVRMNTTADGDNRWDNRKHAAVNMINAEKPTVFGLQEALPEQVAFLDENLPQYDYIGVGRDDGISKGEHMAIFYLKDEVELLDGGTFWLSETPDVPSKGWDAACFRSCTWTKMRMKGTGAEFAYLNTHLDHVGKTSQREGLALMVERCAQIVPKGMTAFVSADFNSVTSDPIYEPLKADMQDSREVAPKTDRRATYNAFKVGNENKPEWVIDHIFFRGANVHEFRVLRDENYGAPFISDHYPVVMTATF